MSSKRAQSDLEQRVVNFLRRNFPQIQMHGGSATIEELDPEAGRVVVQLSGACSGCGISPMTVQAIEARMIQEIPEIEDVEAKTGMVGFGGATPDPTAETESNDDPDRPPSPF